MGAQPVAYLVLTNIPDGEWSFPIHSEKSVIGRSKSAHIVLNARYRSVSRRHAVVWSDRQGLWISDLGSSSGTNINGVWIDHVPRAGLVVGDSICLGEVEIGVRAEIDDLAASCPHLIDEMPTMLKRVIPLARSMAHQLSPAEIDVMLWISRGYQDDVEIAKRLHRSPHTVRTEVGSIFKKFGLHSRAELMGWLKRANQGDTLGVMQLQAQESERRAGRIELPKRRA